MRKYTWLTILLALLIISGCATVNIKPEDPEPDPPALLTLNPAPGSEITLTTLTGAVLILSPGVTFDVVLAILAEAVFEAERMPERATGGGAEGHLTFTGGGGELTVYLFADFVWYQDKAYYLAPHRIKELLAFFAEPPRDPVEIEGLVLVSDLDSSIIIDLKYATADNFTGQVIYPVAVAAINKETGQRLIQAAQNFRQDGYTIKLWDAYRPLSASHLLWAAFPDPRYVIKPQDPPPTTGLRPRHNNGMSVDITLVDSNGNELEMPSAFDDFSEIAAPDYPDMTAAARQNVDYLIAVMESVGFKVTPTEWWHFNDITGIPGPYLDVPLESFLER